MKYLVFGDKGQLGNEFVRYFAMNGIEYTGCDIGETDITSEEAVFNLIKEVKPGAIINCAAYNQVDAAEGNPASALAANSLAVGNIARAARQAGAFVVHYSSDYVFDGSKTTGLYTEEDSANPINEYGRSKLAGEKLLIESGAEYLMFRLSWVYGKGEQNFIFKFMQWAGKSHVLKIASDEVSVPTSTKTIVDITMKSIKKGHLGLYHLTNSGYASRYEWAKEILKITGMKNILYPVSRESFGLAAARPYFSAMDNSLISDKNGIEIPYWQESLRLFLNGGQEIFCT